MMMVTVILMLTLNDDDDKNRQHILGIGRYQQFLRERKTGFVYQCIYLLDSINISVSSSSLTVRPHIMHASISSPLHSFLNSVNYLLSMRHCHGRLVGEASQTLASSTSTIIGIIAATSWSNN